LSLPVPVLIVPGFTNSGPHHWQSWLQHRHPEFVRVEQDDWDRPTRSAWAARLDEYVVASRTPPLLVAHSLGCLTVVHWAAIHARSIHSALLVAPPDLDAPTAPIEEADFRPVPTTALPFRSVLVASTNDPWCDQSTARSLATQWGSDFLVAGACGHLNTAAGFGPWPVGEQLVLQLRDRG
jgi:predicted alpha/beta hydrolase family esterase